MTKRNALWIKNTGERGGHTVDVLLDLSTSRRGVWVISVDGRHYTSDEAEAHAAILGQ